MSIRDVIRDRIEHGQLFELGLVVEGDPVARTVLISAEINALLEGPWQDRSQRVRCGRLRGDLEAFIKGDILTVCLTPYRARSAYMGRLDQPSDEVWDIRSRDPSPALRVLGRFVEKDVFAALTCSPRSKAVSWLPRPPLGDRHSREWVAAISECKSEWSKLFYQYQPYRGSDVHDYISENVILV